MSEYRSPIPSPVIRPPGNNFIAAGYIPNPYDAFGLPSVEAPTPTVSINVGDYPGWNGDGVNDDTTAWLAAIAAIPADGIARLTWKGISLLKPSAVITLPSGCQIDGSGRQSTIRCGAITAASLFTSTTNATDIVFQNFLYDFNGTAKPLFRQITALGSSTTRGITISGVTQLDSTNTITANVTLGFQASSVSNFNCYVQDNIITCGSIQVGGKQNFYLYNVFNGANAGQLIGGNQSTYVGNIVTGETWATSPVQALITAGTSSLLYGNLILTCTCTATTGSFNPITTAASCLIIGNIITNVTAPDAAAGTISVTCINSASGSISESNVISGSNGSSTVGAITSTGISGVQIAFNNQVSGTYEGISISGSANVPAIAAFNEVSSWTDAGIRAVTVNSPLIFYGNWFYNGNNEAIFCSSSSALSGCQIDGNQISTTNASANGVIYVTGFNDVSITNNKLFNPNTSTSVPQIALSSCARGIVKGNYTYAATTPTSGVALSFDAGCSQILYSENVFNGGNFAWTISDSGTNDHSAGNNFTWNGTTWTAL